MPRPLQVTPNPLTLRMQSQGIATALELAEGMQVERSSISRGLNALGGSVLRIGAARSARYALRRGVRNLGDRWPLYRIDEGGQAHEWGLLHATHGGFLFEARANPPDWFRHGYRDGVFPGLPFFLSDPRPQGFLGRAIARAASSTLGVPVDPRDWQDDDILAYLLTHGSDMPGDLVLGDTMLVAAQATAEVSGRNIVRLDERRARFPALAAEAMQGGAPGSSAGGEQPKFLASVRDDTGGLRPVIVKFSAPMDTPAGRRWADLLAAEHHALAVLAANGERVATTALIDAGSRRFLEVTRFDRAGAQGRRGVLTLQAIAAGLLDGLLPDWPAVAAAMETVGLIEPAAAESLRRRWCFGQLTGNTDMHLGNAAVWFGSGETFRLAPAYDMLPMVFAPGPQGEIVPREFAPTQPLPRFRADWNAVVPWARDYWQRVAADDRISPGFRKIAATIGNGPVFRD